MEYNYKGGVSHTNKIIGGKIKFFNLEVLNEIILKNFPSPKAKRSKRREGDFVKMALQFAQVSLVFSDHTATKNK